MGNSPLNRLEVVLIFNFYYNVCLINIWFVRLSMHTFKQNHGYFVINLVLRDSLKCSQIATFTTFLYNEQNVALVLSH